MATSLSQLIALREALERQIAEEQKRAKVEAVAQVRALMDEYGLTATDLAGRVPVLNKRQGQRGKVAAKYRNVETGETWTGRGLKPKWLVAAIADGKSIESFAV